MFLNVKPLVLFILDHGQVIDRFQNCVSVYKKGCRHVFQSVVKFRWLAA